MTSQQKWILFVLALANVLLFCVAVPALFFKANLSGSSATLQPSAAPLTLAAQADTPTAPARPSLTPTKTPIANQAARLPKPNRTLVPKESGWNVYSATEEDFRLELPPSWQPLGIAASAWKDMLEEVKQANPEYINVLRGQKTQLAANGIKFFAYDAAKQAQVEGVTPSVYVLRTTLPVTMSMDTFVQASFIELNRVSAITQPIDHRRVKLPAGDAEAFQYTQRFNTPDGATRTVSTFQYGILRGKDSYVITVECMQTQAVTYKPIFEKIGAGFNWTNK